MHKGWFAVAVGLLVVGCAASDGSDVLGQDESALKGGGRPNDPCATVRCAAGTHCESKGRTASCVVDPYDAGTAPPPLTCASVLCIAGYVCVDSATGPSCQASTTAECTSDSECREEDNYCGGCSCLALATGETAPTCSNPVQCFAAPCQVTSADARCVSGQCTMVASSP